MTEDPYRLLQQRLDELPNGFPPADDGSDLRLLARLFTPEEAALASHLRLTLETAAAIAERTGADPKVIGPQLKRLAGRGLIKAGRAAGGLGFGLIPFIVGFYENQGPVIDAELARLVEAYYRQAFERTLADGPQFHRVIPVEESVEVNMEVRPYESTAEIVASHQSWGVVDCICRKQKALIGEACGHPLDVCMTFSDRPNAFDNLPFVRSQTLEESLATLRRAAEAGLVHTVSNSQDGVTYICNCCTCGCGILRGVAELGMANAVARSAFLCRVDEDLCGACALCVERCQFSALTLRDLTAQVDAFRCVGCGACTIVCPEQALSLVRRPEDEILPPPASSATWLAERAAARGLDLAKVL